MEEKIFVGAKCYRGRKRACRKASKCVCRKKIIGDVDKTCMLRRVVIPTMIVEDARQREGIWIGRRRENN